MAKVRTTLTIDEEVLRTGRPVGRFFNDLYRYSMPIIEGSPLMKQDGCIPCHGAAMGTKDGAVVAVFSSSLRTAEDFAALRQRVLILAAGAVAAQELGIEDLHAVAQRVHPHGVGAVDPAIVPRRLDLHGHEGVEVHKYAVQITVADVRDGACSSSTLQEAAMAKTSARNINTMTQPPVAPASSAAAGSEACSTNGCRFRRRIRATATHWPVPTGWRRCSFCRHPKTSS